MKLWRKCIGVGERVLRGIGLELVHMELERQRGGWYLRYFIDRPGGVSLDDCQRASRQIGAELDLDDLIPGRYTLEVSSPGLDRPLRTDEDFRRSVGKLAVLHTREPVLGRRHFVGRLKSVEEGVVNILDAEGNHWAIARSNISKARLEVEL